MIAEIEMGALTHMEYARFECADCYAILPANEMVRISDKELTGESVTSSASTRKGVSTHGSRTTQNYTYNNKMVCWNCKRIRTRNSIIRAMFIIFIGSAAVYWLAHRSETTAPEPVNATDSRAVINTHDTDSSGDDILPTTLSNGEDAQAQSSATQIDAPSADEEMSTDESNASSDNQTEVAAAIEQATASALDKGDSVRWKVAHKNGYVVVSAPQAYSDKLCRNVIATIIDDQKQIQSAPQLWCQPLGGGKWTEN